MTFINTTGHGYLKITPNQLKKAYIKGFKPTSFSFFNKNNVLLEEDCDFSNYIKTMFPNDEDKKNFITNLKNIHQNDINRNIYSSTPETFEEFEQKMDIFSLNIKYIGEYFVDIFNKSYKITGVQRSGCKGYLYNYKNNTWVMPSTNIVRILN